MYPHANQDTEKTVQLLCHNLLGVWKRNHTAWVPSITGMWRSMRTKSNWAGNSCLSSILCSTTGVRCRMSKASLPLLVTVTSQFIFRSIRCTVFRITGSSSTSKTCPSVTLHKTFVKCGGRKTQCVHKLCFPDLIGFTQFWPDDILFYGTDLECKRRSTAFLRSVQNPPSYVSESLCLKRGLLKSCCPKFS